MIRLGYVHTKEESFGKTSDKKCGSRPLLSSCLRGFLQRIGCFLSIFHFSNNILSIYRLVVKQF